MEYTLIRSKRKTLAIQVKPDGSVVVRSPLRLPKRQIEEAVQRHGEWITKRSQEGQRRQEELRSFAFQDGQTLPFLGAEYRIRGSDVARGITLDGQEFCCPAGSEGRGERFRAWLRGQAAEVFPARVEHFARLMGLDTPKVRITSAKTRWGSCSQSGVNFSCFTAALRMDCIDYVVVHELAHLLRRDHSAQFYRIIEGVLPDYRERIQSIREQQGPVRRWQSL